MPSPTPHIVAARILREQAPPSLYYRPLRPISEREAETTFNPHRRDRDTHGLAPGDIAAKHLTSEIARRYTRAAIARRAYKLTRREARNILALMRDLGLAHGSYPPR